MKALTTSFEGLLVLEPNLFRDHRGFFFESYNAQTFQAATGLNVQFVQDNQSFSYHGVLRGLHFQYGPASQAKLIRVLNGRILDVVVDIRKGSATYGQHYSIELSAENRLQLFVPRGFAHGFVTLSEVAEIFYRCDNFYHPSLESGLIYNDPALAIDWLLPAQRLILSEKDKLHPTLAQLPSVHFE